MLEISSISGPGQKLPRASTILSLIYHSYACARRAGAAILKSQDLRAFGVAEEPGQAQRPGDDV
ncbi:hypothetical protein, partial [Acidithiobacillus ferrooxidans]